MLTIRVEAVPEQIQLTHKICESTARGIFALTATESNSGPTGKDKHPRLRFRFFCDLRFCFGLFGCRFSRGRDFFLAGG